MMTKILALLGLAVLPTGCLMAGNYQSARTLEKGTSATGLTFSFTKYTFTEHTTDAMGNPTTKSVSATWPNFIPEVAYHIGVTDDVTVGGRVALGSGGIEGDVLWRFFHNDKLHLAIDPAVGYQALFLIEGETFRLPAILTYDLNDYLSINLAAFGGITHFKDVNASSTSSSNTEAGAFAGSLVSMGGSVGFELRGEVLAIRPAIEVQRWQANLGGETFDPFTTVNVMVHVAWIGGREKKQLNRMERKLDRVLDNQGDKGAKPNDDSDYKPQGEPIK
jgi:hypothetical protein